MTFRYSHHDTKIGRGVQTLTVGKDPMGVEVRVAVGGRITTICFERKFGVL